MVAVMPMVLRHGRRAQCSLQYQRKGGDDFHKNLLSEWMSSLYDSQPARMFPHPVGQDHVDMERLHFWDAAQAQDSGLVMCRFFGDAFV